MDKRRLKSIVGRAERVNFQDGDIEGVPAKIDTGAWRSSVWATDIEEKDGKLHFKLLGADSKYYSGKEMTTNEYEEVTVENSFGHTEDRFAVMLRMQIAHKTVKSQFTLSDRAEKTYPVLVGRKFLKGKFIVDVQEGEPITDEEEDDE